MIIDFGNDGKGGGTSCELQEVAITYTTNGINELVPDVGKDGISKATVTVDVPDKPVDARKTVDVVENGTIEIDPGAGYDSLAGATVNVNVPTGGGGLDWEGTGYTPAESGSFEQDIQASIDHTKQKYAEWTPGQTNANSFYSSDLELIYAPVVDMSSCTSAMGMFQNCDNLRTVPAFDLSSCVDCRYMFSYCTSITEIPAFDLSSCVECQSMFENCQGVVTVPAFDLSSCVNCRGMFNYCLKLTKIPTNLTTSKVENMSSLITNCNEVTEIGEIDCSSVKTGDMFSIPSNKVTTLGGFRNLKVSLNMAGESWRPVDKLDKQSIMNVINDLAQADPAFEAQPKLTLSSASYALLTPDDIAIATGKGWTVVENS